MSHDHVRHVLLAVLAHPAAMSASLLAYLLRGEALGRLAEKRLDASPHRGALADVPAVVVAEAIQGCVAAGWLSKGAGVYPALRPTALGEAQLAAGEAHLATGERAGSVEAAPEVSYRAYHRWRHEVASQRRTPPYRILPNTILTALAARRPQTLGQLLAIPGLGKRRALRYQQGLTAVGRALHAQGEG